jgi:hypothetical protein
MARDKDSLGFLLGASALTVVLWFIPFAGLLVYPFRLFVTFIHEGGHALATLITFGSVEYISIHADGSGLTYSRGGLALLVSSAGYLSSTAYGASLLALCRQGRNAKMVLAITAATILGMTVFFVSGLFGWITGILLTAGLIFIALASSARVAHFSLSFLAVQCCLNALYDLNTLFVLSATTRAQSDAVNMQRLTYIPAIFWALLWLGLSIIVLGLALRSYVKRGGSSVSEASATG